ncbi:hypothetical protein XANCAGTX0491_006038 [Xanthoria calcicola]
MYRVTAILSRWAILYAVFCELVYPSRLEPANPFPPPTLHPKSQGLDVIFDNLERDVQDAARNGSSPWLNDITSFSVAVTSTTQTLWTTSYTAPILGNYSNGPPTTMSDQSYFRIASISKVFTVLAILLQEKAGNCSLRDPISRHVSELNERAGADPHTAEWDSITLETLASQLSGIPREYGQCDMTDPLTDRVYRFDDPVDIGLPPVYDSDVPPCGRNRPGTRPCSRKEILDGLMKLPPSFEPNYKATYSNLAFVLLGFALENMTGLEYADVVRSSIFDPLGMERASLARPPDTEGIIPSLPNDWNVDVGTYGSTGGIYTTASDLALFARSVLAKNLLDTTTTNAWFHPRSFSSSWSFAYGMPWEIFRTSDMLPDSDRIQTIFTKGGALNGYFSQLLLIPEYNLGLVVLVAGDGHATRWLREKVLKLLIPAVEQIARDQAASKLSGSYMSNDATINSSTTFEVSGSRGLVLTSWLSNGTDFLAQYGDMSNPKRKRGHVQLTPSNVSRGKNSEVWRAAYVLDELLPSDEIVNANLIVDVDIFSYASRSLEEFVFELDDSGRATKVTLPGFRITLDRQADRETLDAFVRLREPMKPLGLTY